jgi:fructokinase
LLWRQRMPLSAVCYGEVLWDIFPTHKKIEDSIKCSFKNEFYGVKRMLSRVGRCGWKWWSILSYLNDHAISTDLIQVTN